MREQREDECIGLALDAGNEGFSYYFASAVLVENRRHCS